MIANILDEFVNFFSEIWKFLVDIYNAYFNWLSGITSPEMAMVITIILGFLVAVCFFLFIIRRSGEN